MAAVAIGRASGRLDRLPTLCPIDSRSPKALENRRAQAAFRGHGADAAAMRIMIIVFCGPNLAAPQASRVANLSAEGCRRGGRP